MRDFTTDGLTEGETYTATIEQANGDIGETGLTVEEIENRRSAYVEMESGHRLLLSSWGDQQRDEIAVLAMASNHDQHVADLLDIEVA